jgi:hypothetical protein
MWMSKVVPSPPSARVLVSVKALHALCVNFPNEVCAVCVLHTIYPCPRTLAPTAFRTLPRTS